MADLTPPSDQPAPDGKNSEFPEQPLETGLGPAYAILRALVGDRMPSGPLGPDTVPATLLALPIRLATDRLIQHAKKCKNPNCGYVPSPLWRYRRMRPDAIRGAGDEVHRVLWTHADHELVVWVRRVILAEHSELAKEVSTGSLLRGDKLRELLNGSGAEGPRLLAAVLWASKFKGPDAEDLFRSLVPLVQGGSASGTEKVVAEDDDQRLRSLAAELRSKKKELKRAKQAADQAQRALHPKELALERARAELADVQQRHRQMAEERDHLLNQVRESDASLATLKRDAETAARVNADLRRDLRRLQQDLRNLSVERSDLARKLGAEAQRVERLKLENASLPRGAEAVWQFLRAEEDRIQVDRKILSGAPKLNADKEWTVRGKLERAFLDAFPQYTQPRPVRKRPKTPLRFIALGGSSEVGKSCYLLELGTHRILVDCGIKPSESKDLYPEIERLERIDALILTHAHTDHIGWVPALVHRFPDLEIYCSDGTAALLPVVLEDCRWHYARKMAAQRERAKYSRNAEIVEDAYDEDDVHIVPDLAITCQFGEEDALPFGDASVRFFRAGHILGAASVLIQDQSGRRIFFSGDFSSFPQLTVPAANWPADLDELDLLVLESTYGNRNHPPLEESRHDLLAFIRETVETREGSVILASFALGRAQELLKLIVTAQRSGQIRASTPVHVDGLIRRINPIYQKLADFDPPRDSFNEVSGETERQEVAHSAQRVPSIIVTTSGMLAGGPVVEYARRLLPDPRHRIVLTGYQDEGAPSRALRDLTRSGGPARLVQVPDESGALVEFEAALPAKEVRLSSHADQSGLIEYAGRLRPKCIALVHGDAEAQNGLSFRLSKVHPGAEITSGPSELVVP